MSKFKQLEASKIKPGKTAEYELFGIVGMEGAKVFGRPATRRLNLPYSNAVMAKTEKLNRQSRSTKNKAGILNAQSDAAREPFARFVLTGWEGIKDSDGKEVPFSTADAVDFIAAIPDLMFDELIIFFSSETNFIDTITVDEAKETAKN